MTMRTVSFAVPTADEVRALDRLAGELRTNGRARRVADGLPIQEAIEHYFAELAGKTGSR